MTDRSDPEFSRIYAQRRRRQIVLLFVVLPVGAVSIVFRFTGIHELFGISTWTFAVGLLLFVGLCLAFSRLNWRCPRCAEYLGESLDHSHCPGCGIPLSSRPKENGTR